MSQTAASALKELQRAGACASPGTPDEAVTKALFKAAKAFVDAAVKDLNDRRLEGPD